MKLLGPVPFDPLSLDRSARDLLGAFRHERDSLKVGDGRSEGLYLLVDDADALRGFWMTFGERWLDDGVVGGRVPPFARALLEAAVEELWWEGLDVAPRVLEAWRPLIVLEWPPFLADRSMVPPPGSTLAVEDPEDDGLDVVKVARDLPDVGAGWLDPEHELTPDDPTDERAAAAALGAGPADAPWAELGADRGIVCLVRGSLRRRAGVHQGRFELMCMPDPEEGLGLAGIPNAWKRGIPADDWIAEAASTTSRPPVEPALGFPLRLPGAPRVAFPLTGWLTRDLDVQPAVPRDVEPTNLVPRDTSNPLFAQVVLAASVTSLLLLVALSFSQVAQALSEPRRVVAARPVSTEVQPAISVCSPDHDGFVDQLRCQIDALASGTPREQVRCRDQANAIPTEDLQATWCGLRRRDWGTGPKGEAISMSQVAASQACFDVLGRSYRYRDDAAPPGVVLADPAALLHDPLLKIDALDRVVDELDKACDLYEPRLKAQVSGAVLAAHVGTPAADAVSSLPATSLPEVAFRAATAAVGGRSLGRCLRAGAAGAEDGPGDPTSLDALCDGDLAPAPVSRAGAWSKLAGDPAQDTPSVVARYVSARFGDGMADASSLDGRPPVWGCYDYLDAKRARPPAQGLWDLAIDSPQRWGGRRGPSQLRLDAWLRVLREDPDQGDPCWREVDRLMAGYSPVHPLRSGLADEGWPSVEQRVCGDVCAVAYGVETGPGEAWVTRGSDLEVCVTRAAPPRQDLDRVGRGTLDELRIPWNGEPWSQPDAAAVCAFNLTAQGRLPGVLPEDRSGPEWSGELVAGRRIAGGEAGSSVRSANALATFGARRSLSTCADVAVQCFVEDLFAVVTDPAIAPLEWRTSWQDEIAALPERLDRAGADSRPWCALVLPYLYPEGQLPEGQLDLTCAKGVTEARDRVDTLAGRLAKRVYEEGGQ